MGKTVIIIVLILLLGGGIYFLISKGIVKNPLQKNSLNPSLGAQIFEKTHNPIQDKIPETNPFSKVNPFKGVYKNPFQ